MTDTFVSYRFLVRAGTAAALAAVNEIPLARELVLETDTLRFKFGDGTRHYADLDYASAAIVHPVSGAPSSALGRDGDFALDGNASAPMLYGPKAGGSWPAGVPLKGAKGDKGDTGATGLKGDTGSAGLSAYQVAVANGFGGTQAEWLVSLKGAQGDRGEQGPAGLAAARRVQLVADTDTGSVACDWSAYDEIRITLTANTTLTFAGALDGQGCILKLRQDAVGSRSVSLPANVRTNAIIAAYSPTLVAGKADLVGVRYDGQDSRYDLVSLIQGIGA